MLSDRVADACGACNLRRRLRVLLIFTLYERRMDEESIS